AGCAPRMAGRAPPKDGPGAMAVAHNQNLYSQKHYKFDTMCLLPESSKAGMTTDSPRTGKWQSGAITDGPSRAAARSMLHAVGFDGEARAKPILGAANTCPG